MIRNEKEIRRVLAAHGARYPLMRPQDAVKLLYEGEFGSGESPLPSLAAQCAAAASQQPDIPLWEDLGGDMVRINLAALDRANYPVEQLHRDLARSAALRRGDMERFENKLIVLVRLTREGALPFPLRELEDYLDEYLAAECPPVSHSPQYCAAYRPAYGVVLRRVCFPLFAEEVNSLQGRPALVALDGRCAAGKTTVSEYLHQAFHWSVIHMDHFFLPTQRRTSQPGGNIDFERLLRELLLPLRQGGTPLCRPFDCRSQQLLDPLPFSPGPVVLVEGSYACHPALRDQFDLCAFLDIDPARQMERVIAREGADGAQVFRDKWIPLEEQYFSACGVEDACAYHFNLIEAGPRP